MLDHDVPAISGPRQRAGHRRPALTGAVPPPRGRVFALDGLRLLAALSVVAYHYTARVGSWPKKPETVFPALFPVTAYGWLGVHLFFLISGFVICMSCWGKPLRDFFVSRVVRLYPAYWFGVLATTVTLAVFPKGNRHLPWTDVLTNLTMLQEPLGVPSVDGAYWSLFAELRFYVLFAALACWGLTYRRVLVFCCVWATASMLCAKAEPGPLRLLVMPEYSWYFIAGIAFYLMYHFRPNLMLTGIVLLCFAAGLPATLKMWRSTGVYVGRLVPAWPVVLILALSFALLALVATGKLSWIRWSWLTYAGAITYPLYLTHQMIGWELFHTFSGRIATYPLLALVTTGLVLMAWLIHRCVERPLGRRLKRGLIPA
ncbi:acyltransferase family protein [Streptomyces sp. NPDC048111]|uniref:acyltransferase family protein n=1 Tax=Streptomyces sp. NPDC048111 TaxID=3365500 RepID=UPI0037146BC8